MNFTDLNLHPALLKALEALGFQAPTPIQAKAIPMVLSGGDLMAAAQTGTGKTGSFALPILHQLAEEAPARDNKNRVIPRAIVLAPTRELAAQIDESFKEFAKYLKLKTIVVYGGVSINPQIQKLRQGIDIIIATPGRLLDLYEQGFIDASAVQTLVLDEADRMLDMGFIPDIRKIISILPDQRQTLLFSATFSNEIRALATQLLNDPQSVEVAPRNSTVDLIEQVAYPVSRDKKLELLLKLIKENDWYQILLFTRTKSGANRVSTVFERSGLKTGVLHGGKSQAARTRAMNDFKKGDIQVLVATDIAARGIDIDQLPCVINYELPNISEDYVHRIGRTGRAGAKGIAISLVTVDEAGFLQQIEKLINHEIEKVLLEEFAPQRSEKAMPIVMGRQILWGGIGSMPNSSAIQEYIKSERKNLSRAFRESQQQQAKPARARSSDEQSQSRPKRSAPAGRRRASDDSSSPQKRQGRPNFGRLAQAPSAAKPRKNRGSRAGVRVAK